MNKKRIIAAVVCMILFLSNTIFAFADGTASKKGGVDDSVWTVEDFTYGDMDRRVYGCDYTREIYVVGKAITGFSEKGLEKLEGNKDLVIPALDPDGNLIVGIGQNAFKGMGLTSVSFPTGMMTDYNDKITHKVTKRGNFVIEESAFASNELTEVSLPEGVIACMPYAFMGNKIETVRFPKTIWWIESMAFAKNRITDVYFPPTCDFQLELHGMPFANNFIKSVRLPDYTEVVNKHSFGWNTGMEPVSEDLKEELKTYTVDGVTYNVGIVYMYTDNAELEGKDRIHHNEKATASQKSDFQKLVVNDGTEATKNQDQEWTTDDFTYKGTVVTGLSASGIEKRKTNRNLIIPETNKEGLYVTEIASATPAGYGLFGADQQGFDYVYIPSGVKKIGDYAFQNCGIKDIAFPCKLEEIGMVAFQTNNLTSVILPDTVTKVGTGAFATNPKLERISLSKKMTEIEASAFGCSDQKNWMTNLTSIELHEGITKIGDRAFAANNFSKIELPSTVKSIGEYAFSTKNYLKTPCEVVLNEGLETIGTDAFRNKIISEITIPSTVKGIPVNTFRKEYSDDTEVVVTKLYVSLQSQYEDKENFPESEFHKIYLTDSKVWAADDFKYGAETFENLAADAWVITGFSEEGEKKFAENKELVIPAVDPDGKAVQGIGSEAFSNAELSSLTLPKNIEDFCIGANAFSGNKLEILDLPEGVVWVGESAFAENELTTVKFPTTIKCVDKEAFYDNKIETVEFPERTESALQIESKAFAKNRIQMVRLPVNTEKVDKWAFLQNTGVEKVSDGTAEEMAGGLVYMYMEAETVSSLIAYKSNGTSVVQELFLEAMPNAYLPWGGSDFTYNEDGTVITGLSEMGRDKIKVNPEVVLPEQGPEGTAIRGLGNGTTMQGIFVYAEGKKWYTPSSVRMPKTLTSIGDYTFALDPSKTYEAEMSTILFLDGLEEIGMAAFQNSKLVSIAIPDSVTTMGMGAFTGSKNLTSVKLSKNMTEIPRAAFSAGMGAAGLYLGTVEIPEGVKIIGEKAFDGASIEELILPDTLEVIGDTAFGNHQLKELEIPGSVKKIERYAFRVMQEDITPSLKTLILHEGLETIGEQAFSGNVISEVKLPSTVKITGEKYLFGSATKPADPIVKVYVSDKSIVDKYNTESVNKYSHEFVYDNLISTDWSAEDFTYDESTGTLTGWSESGYKKRLTCKNLVLPEYTPEGREIVAIGDEAFKIPNDEVKQTTMGVDSPNGMLTVVIPKTVKTIGEQAFSQNALQTVELGSVESIGERAFYGNDLVKVELPDTVTKLGSGAFSANDITELKLSAGVTVIPQGAFSMNIRLEHIDIPDTVTEIQETAFAGARLTSLEIPDSVVKIGRKAFHLHRMTELTIPGSVKEIGESAFEGTYKGTTLKTLILEEGIEVIGKYAFKEGLLETVVLPTTVESIGEKPFLNNKGKDGTQVVELLVTNLKQTSFKDETYEVVYVGKYSINDFADEVKLSFDTVSYSGKKHEPKVTIKGLKEGVDFKVQYKNNIEAGTATVEIIGIGRYSGLMYKEFTITENSFVEENTDLQKENEKLKQEVEALQKELESLKAQMKQSGTTEVVVVKDESVKESEESEADSAEDTDVDAAEDMMQEEVSSEENLPEENILEEVQGVVENNNKLIIGLVLGMLIGGSIVYLLSGKRKK